MLAVLDRKELLRQNGYSISSVDKLLSRKGESLTDKDFSWSDAVDFVLSKFSKNKRARAHLVLNYLSRLSLKYKYVDPMQYSIASVIGASLSTAKRLLRSLIGIGLLSKLNRSYATCCYFLDSRFFTADRNMMLRKYKAFIPFALALLVSLNVNKENVKNTLVYQSFLKNDLLILVNSKRYINSITMFVRGADSVADTINLKIDRRGVMKLIVGPTINEIGDALQATDHGKLMLTAFQDSIIRQAYELLKEQDYIVGCKIKWLWFTCRDLSKQQSVMVRSNHMKALLCAHNWKPGMILTAESTYNAPQSLQQTYEDKSLNKHGDAIKKAINSGGADIVPANRRSNYHELSDGPIKTYKYNTGQHKSYEKDHGYLVPKSQQNKRAQKGKDVDLSSLFGSPKLASPSERPAISQNTITGEADTIQEVSVCEETYIPQKNKSQTYRAPEKTYRSQSKPMPHNKNLEIHDNANKWASMFPAPEWSKSDPE